MPDYNNTQIYKITSPNTDKIYIGHTTRTLKGRLSSHKTDNKRFKSRCVGQIIDAGDCKITLITIYPCNNKIEAIQGEQKQMELYSDCCVNERRAFVSKKQIADYYKNYYIINKDTIKEQCRVNKKSIKSIDYNKNYYIINKDKIKAYRLFYKAIENLKPLFHDC